MQKAAKLNHHALGHIQKIVERKPELAYLNDIFRPMCEILPKDPINTIVPLIHVPPTESKYDVMPITEKKGNTQKKDHKWKNGT